jgi:hypothetical protein
MSARIIVTLILEYGGNDTAEYDAAMEIARELVSDDGEEIVGRCTDLRVVEVQVSG